MNARSSAAKKAELIIHNGNIATLTEERPFARAVAMADVLFLAVGNDREVMACRDSGTQVIDAGGRTVIPGLTMGLGLLNSIKTCPSRTSLTCARTPSGSSASLSFSSTNWRAR